MPESNNKTYNRRNGGKNKNENATPAQDEFGNLQPQALDMERAVIGAIIIEPGAYDEISEVLRPESFYDKRHGYIFSAARSLSIAQKPIDLFTLREQLTRDGKIEESGGLTYLAELSEQMTSSAHIQTHARVIAQKYLARQLIVYSANVQRGAFDPTQDTDALMQTAEGKLFELSQTNLKKDYEQIDPVIREAINLIEKASAQSSGISGIPSGFTDLDHKTSGWQNSDLVILAARPAMGKTAFALSMAKNIAVDANTPIAFFSLEMSNVQLVNRLIANACSIDASKLRSGNLLDAEWSRLHLKINDLLGAPLYVDDTPALSIFELRTKARRLVREHGVKIIMIDYLQLMNASGMSFGNRQEEVSTISRSLKGLARELNIPILALSQLNRGVESREGNEGKRPQLSDLRESGAIEQDADMVIFIHRPEYYRIYEDKGKDLRGKAEIIIAKHRNGSVGDVLLNFRGQFVRFENEESTSFSPFAPEPTEGGELPDAPTPSPDSHYPPMPIESTDDVPY